jgi:hypothetical protein
MALSEDKRATTVILDRETDRLLTLAARERGLSRSEYIRSQLSRALEQYRRHPRPRSAGTLRRATPADDERDLFVHLEK